MSRRIVGKPTPIGSHFQIMIYESLRAGRERGPKHSAGKDPGLKKLSHSICDVGDAIKKKTLDKGAKDETRKSYARQ